MITRLAARHGLTFEAMADLVSEIQEGTAVSNRQAPSTMLLRMVKRGYRVIIDSRTNEELAIKAWCFALSMGWYDVIDGIQSCTELGRKLKLTKADINKFAVLFRDVIPDGLASMPPTAGQRNDGARVKFGRLRHKQEEMRRRVKDFEKGN